MEQNPAKQNRSSQWNRGQQRARFPEEPKGEPDAALLSTKLRHAGFSSVNEADVQEWLNVDSNEPGHTALTEEEIVQVVSKPDEEDEEEDDELIADEPAVPSHGDAYACLSTCIQWLEA